jgi:isopentenyl-diphosphate delta-isomerase
MNAGAAEPIVELVDPDGSAIGAMPKLAAHAAPGHLHRAISVFLVDPLGRVLLQRRAATKYHWPGAWANSCCGHPFPAEPAPDGAARRVADELGIILPASAFRPAGLVTYTALDDQTGLVEREYDHLFVARFDGRSHPDGREVRETDLVAINALRSGWRPPDPAPWLDVVLDGVAPVLFNLRID